MICIGYVCRGCLCDDCKRERYVCLRVGICGSFCVAVLLVVFWVMP